MGHSYASFVVLGGVRTGSNFLERSLDGAADVVCLGELFNHDFIGRSGVKQLDGWTMADRDADPEGFWMHVRSISDGVPGFRLFPGHDARILDHVLRDQTCAKILLTRNPLESYISVKLALKSGQWIMTGSKNKSEGLTVDFDAREFEQFLETRSAFLKTIRHVLQQTGQGCFGLRYEDLGELDVLNGALAFIGATGRLEHGDTTLKKQNTQALCERVTNVHEMQDAVAALDPFGIETMPVEEPQRAAGARSFFVGANSGLVLMPIDGGPLEGILDWMASVEGCARGQLETGLGQKDLRRALAGRSTWAFAAVRHPVLRAYAAFDAQVFRNGADYRAALSDAVLSGTGLEDKAPDSAGEVPASERRDLFMRYLATVRQVHSGASKFRVNTWLASQHAVIQGASSVLAPSIIVKEELLQTELPFVAQRAGKVGAEYSDPQAGQLRDALNEIYADSVEAAVRGVYARDYAVFGFGDWTTADQAA